MKEGYDISSYVSGIGLGTFRVQCDGFAIVSDGSVDFAFISISNTPIVVGVSIFRVQCDSFIIVFDLFVDLAFITIGNTPIVIEDSKMGIQF